VRKYFSFYARSTGMAASRKCYFGTRFGPRVIEEKELRKHFLKDGRRENENF
jgi:hypothetical protein